MSWVGPRLDMASRLQLVDVALHALTCQIELVCDDALAPRVVETLQQSAGTGSIGDGKIFVLDVGQAVRIRTGETGEAAL